MAFKEKCFICGANNAELDYDNHTDYQFRICPVCGRYILPDSTILMLMDEKPQNRDYKFKLAKYLFYNKIEHRNAFIGTQKAFEDYIKINPEPEAFLVTQQMVENWYPRSFAEKIDKILMYLANVSLYNGYSCKFKLKEISYLLFMHNSYGDGNWEWEDELEYLLKYFHENSLENNLGEVDLIDYVDNLDDEENPFSIVLSPIAWEKVYELQKSLSINKNVFVAMKFGKETNALREKIKEGLEGYNVRIMDEIEHNHQIVPEMLYEIRNSKFVIAELSNHNNGAYYEAGYALGLGKEVIHICQKNELSNGLHFDVAQVNTIVYENIDEIPEKLKKRIQATIR